MNSKSIKRLTILLSALLLVCLTVGLILGFSNKSTVNAEVQLVGWDEKVAIYVGDNLSSVTPEGGVKISVDETEIPAIGTIIELPNGMKKQFSNDYSFTTAGLYYLNYSVEHEGKTYTEKKEILVNEGIYSYTNDLVSKAEYFAVNDLTGYHEYREKEHLAPGYGEGNYWSEYFGKNNASYLVHEKDKVALGELGVEGVIDISLADGDAFKFKKTANLYDLAETNGGMVDLCTIFPKILKDYYLDGSIESRYAVIKFIDCFDESNYIECYVWAHKSSLYVGAGASYQSLSSVVQKSTAKYAKEFSENGVNYGAYMPTRYQEDTVWGSTACDTIRLYDVGINFRWDTKTNKIYTTKLNTNTNPNILYDAMITDLDNDTLYPDNPFTGFTTGDVYAQIEFKCAKSTAMEIQVSELYGYTGEGLANGKNLDETKPQIKLDDGSEFGIYYDSYINSTVSLPTASVFDINGASECEIAVYYEYDSHTPILCNLENNQFVPKRAGNYTAVYSSTDIYGNEAKKFIYFLVKNEKLLTFDEDKKSSEFIAGGQNILQSQFVDVQNSGFIEKVTLTQPNGEVVDITATLNDGKYYIIPEFVGEYTVEYLFNKGYNTDSYSYKVSSVDNGTVAFIDELPIPSLIIKDATYDFDDYYAYKPTANGFEKVLAKLYICTDGSNYGEIADQHRVKISTDQSEVKFKAIYGDYSSKEVTSSVVDVNYAGGEWTREVRDRTTGEVVMENGSPKMETVTIKKIHNFFVGYDNYVGTNKYIEYYLDGITTESLQYATPMALNAFGINFAIEENNDKFNEVSVILREIGKKANSGYVISYRYDANAASVMYTVTTLDQTKTLKSVKLGGTLARTYELRMEDGNLKTNDGVTTLIPSLDARNIEFALIFNNPTGEFKVKVSKIINQNFNANVKPNAEVKPTVTFTSTGAQVKAGDQTVLPQFNASMAFNPTVMGDLTLNMVYAGGTKTATDVNGVELTNYALSYGKEIKISLPEHSSYIGTFVYKLGSRTFNGIDAKCVINTVDKTAPTVTFNDGSTAETLEEIAINTEHTFKEFTVSDDLTASEELYIKKALFDENNNIIAWNLDKYTFTKAGVYKVMIYCQDSANNTTKAYYYVSVK